MTRSARQVFIGVDVGTTTSKALVRTADQRDVGVVEAATPWQTHDGWTETNPELLSDLATTLILRGVRVAEETIGPVHVRGVGVTGMGECGVLLDGSGRPAAPVMAWFDPRGEGQVDGIRAGTPGFAGRFESKTGLPWSCQASIAKLIWLQENGTCIGPGHRWLSIPEWIVHRLGGEQVREPSLASRTGLIDQGTGAPWLEGLTVAGLAPSLLPDELAAGQVAGSLRPGLASTGGAPAVLTVAGHDHAVAALGAGAVNAEELFNSNGTADVVVRSVSGGLNDQQRRILVGCGWSAGRHVVPDTTLLIAGVRGGLLLRRVLGALGADSPEGRATLDRASLAVGTLPAGLEVTGAGRTGNEVVIRLPDGGTPAAVWAAATRHTAAETRAALTSVEHVVGPHRRAVASGGWTRMSSVRAAKASVIEHLTFSPTTQPGLTGAALLAMYAASDRSVSIAEFIDEARAAAEPLAAAI
jgi:sugar (pentulose or hexulose) kinase